MNIVGETGGDSTESRSAGLAVDTTSSSSSITMGVSSDCNRDVVNPIACAAASRSCSRSASSRAEAEISMNTTVSGAGGMRGGIRRLPNLRPSASEATTSRLPRDRFGSARSGETAALDCADAADAFQFTVNHYR